MYSPILATPGDLQQQQNTKHVSASILVLFYYCYFCYCIKLFIICISPFATRHLFLCAGLFHAVWIINLQYICACCCM